MGSTVGAKLRDLLPKEENHLKESVKPQDQTPDWDTLLRRADMLARRHGGSLFGYHALGLSREIDAVLGVPRVDWRTILWQHLTPIPNDWIGWDRRSICKGQYLPKLDGRQLRAIVGIDTSGSIDSDMLEAFLTELSGIVQSVPHLKVDLHWTDTETYGPISITSTTEVSQLKPQGGGGTDLRPLFDVADTLCKAEGLASIPVIYLTDCEGPMPQQELAHTQTLWVMPNPSTTNPPFGDTIVLEAMS
jgi:predicted metal-dependent peptidase